MKDWYYYFNLNLPYLLLNHRLKRGFPHALFWFASIKYTRMKTNIKTCWVSLCTHICFRILFTTFYFFVCASCTQVYFIVLVFSLSLTLIGWVLYSHFFRCRWIAISPWFLLYPTDFSVFVHFWVGVNL